MGHGEEGAACLCVSARRQVGSEGTVGDDGVEVGVPVGKGAVGLDADNPAMASSSGGYARRMANA